MHQAWQNAGGHILTHTGLQRNVEAQEARGSRTQRVQATAVQPQFKVSQILIPAHDLDFRPWHSAASKLSRDPSALPGRVCQQQQQQQSCCLVGKGNVQQWNGHHQIIQILHNLHSFLSRNSIILHLLLKKSDPGNTGTCNAPHMNKPCCKGEGRRCTLQTPVASLNDVRSSSQQIPRVAYIHIYTHT